MANGNNSRQIHFKTSPFKNTKETLKADLKSFELLLLLFWLSFSPNRPMNFIQIARILFLVFLAFFRSTFNNCGVFFHCAVSKSVCITVLFLPWDSLLLIIVQPAEVFYSRDFVNARGCVQFTGWLAPFKPSLILVNLKLTVEQKKKQQPKSNKKSPLQTLQTCVKMSSSVDLLHGSTKWYSLRQNVKTTWNKNITSQSFKL